MAVKRLLDTNTALYLLGGRLAEPLPAGEYFISVITEIELLSYPSLEARHERQIQGFLNEVVIVDLNSEVKQVAIKLRRAHRLKLPDAIIAATAIVTDIENYRVAQTSTAIPAMMR